MNKQDNIAGALEDSVHIPRLFPQRDGVLISSAGFVMWAMAFILIIVSAISAQSETFTDQESDIKMFIAGFAGLVMFYISTPFLLVGSIYVLNGRKRLPPSSRTSIVTGFILFQILLFITMISTPLYYVAAINSNSISSSIQALVVFLETLFFLAWFLMLIPFTTREKRSVFVTGFVLMMVPLGIFTFIALVSTGSNSFFLSPLPLYIVKATFYTTVSAVLFWVFQSLREIETNIKAVSFILKRPRPPINTDDNMNHPQTNLWVSSSVSADRTAPLHPSEASFLQDKAESASPLTRREFTPEGADDRRSSERSGHPPPNGGDSRRGFLRMDSPAAEEYRRQEINDAEDYPEDYQASQRHGREYFSRGSEPMDRNGQSRGSSPLFVMKEDPGRNGRRGNRKEEDDGKYGRRYEW